MAHVEVHTRTTCLDCGDPLTRLDENHDLCLLSRVAIAKGRVARGERMALVRKQRRAQGRVPTLPADPFQGFREGE